MPAMQWGVVLGVALVALLFDLKSRRIPNPLTMGTFVAGLVWATWMHGLAGFGEALGAALLLAVPYVLLFVFAGGGAGDAKLMGALGAWLGLINGVVTLFAVAVAGGILSLLFALFKGRMQSVLANLRRILVSLWMHVVVRASPADIHRAMPDQEGMLKIPYALAIFLGACLACAGVQLWK